MATRTTRKTTAKKTPAKKTAPARKTPATKTNAPAAERKPAPVILAKRPKLAVRRRLFVGPHGPHEQAAIRAALAAAATRLPIPVRTWNGSTARLADGVLIIHNPGHDRAFTAHIACPHGAIHGWPINTHDDLRGARTATRECTTPHGGYNADQAIREGVTTTVPSRPVFQLQQIAKCTADTQPLALADIEATTAKEHPQP
jgi:hypothetical protein